MSTVSKKVPVKPDVVFSVLADGWAYGSWVVGASHIRAVDATWPAKGSRIHHSSGAWPVQVEDITTVVAMKLSHFLHLEARLWVLGTADIQLTLIPVEDGTMIRMTELLVEGPAKYLPNRVQSIFLKPRNTEALARLADRAMGVAQAGQKS